MEVNLLVCWFFRGCERGDFCFAHDHCSHFYEFLGVVGALLVWVVKLNPRPTHHGCLGSFKTEDILDAHACTSKRSCGGWEIVKTARDRDALPQSI